MKEESYWVGRDRTVERRMNGGDQEGWIEGIRKDGLRGLIEKGR